MTPFFRSFAPLALLLPLTLLAPHAPAQAGEAMRIVLSPEGRYVRSTDPFFLQIALEIRQATDVDFGLLDGTSLQVYLDKELLGPLTPREEAPEREPWRLRAGAQLNLRVPVDLEGLLRRFERPVRPGTVYELAVQAGGDTSTRTPFTVVCNPGALTLADLDLSKTKVALVTNYGTMIASFRPDKAPKTVENFVKLAKDGFYDGTKFHRIVQNFMIQGGDPNTKDGDPRNDGTGGPGYRIQDEFSNLTHERGALSMASLGTPNSAGSQFFVMHGKRPDLDGRYAVFGKLVEGLDTLDRIAAVPTGPQPMNPREASRPTQDVVLVRAVVLPTLR